MTVSMLPIRLVEMTGALLVILFSILSVHHALRLKRRDPENVVWTYLLWISYCMAGFAVSRSLGHIFKQVLYVEGRGDLWAGIRPVSGSIDTLMLVLVAAVTLFFNRVWHVYQAINRDRAALNKNHGELTALNRTLEARVRERTDALLRHEKQMAHADRLASIGQLSSGIAHEINNPLGIIQGYTELLLRDEALEDQKREDLRMILKHTRNCKAIVEDLLNFARRSKPEKAEIDLHDLIEDALVFGRHQSNLEKVHIETDYAENIPRMVLDEKKIKQVLINLLLNAGHAINNRGTIRIGTEYDPSADRVKIRVADDGHGIDPKNLPRIFDPFFTTKPTGEGTGLGLAVSYGIVRNHGGEIQVESAPGEGAVFTLVLPVHAANGS